MLTRSWDVISGEEEWHVTTAVQIDKVDTSEIYSWPSPSLHRASQPQPFDLIDPIPPQRCRQGHHKSGRTGRPISACGGGHTILAQLLWSKDSASCITCNSKSCELTGVADRQ
jgi:hypothetical protein